MDNEYNYYNPDKDCRSGGSGGSQPERGPVKKKHKGAAMVAELQVLQSYSVLYPVRCF